MSDTTTIAPAEPQPPPPAVDHSSEIAEIRESIRGIQGQDDTPRALWLEEGAPRPTYPDPLSASKAVARARKEKDAAEAPAEPEIDLVGYVDGRDRNEPVDPRTAAKDINEYRQAKAAQLRADLGLEQPAETEPQIEQPQQPEQAEPTSVPEPPETKSWQAAEQARRQYQDALSVLVAGGTATVLNEFADIQTAADLARVIQKEPERVARFQAHQAKLQAVNAELATMREQATAQAAERFQSYSKIQDSLAEELVPELSANADPKARAELQNASIATLKGSGFTDGELRAAWEGRESFNVRDARVQKIISQSAKWELAQAKARVAVAKPVPPVQRPGVSTARTEPANNLAPLMEKLAQSGKLRDAAKLRAAQLENRRARG